MIKLVAFDFDGVVIEGSNEGYFRCYHKALEEVGVSFSPEEERKRILDKWGSGYKSQLTYLLMEKPELVSRAIEIYEHYYHHTNLFFRDINLIPGAKESLTELSSLYRLAIATGMIRKTLDKLIGKFDLKGIFDATMAIDEVKREEDKKPAPFMLNQLMDVAKVTSEETVYVGDGKSDVVMAKNAGATPIVVLTGHLDKKEAENLGVKKIISDINSLKGVLEELNKA